MANVTSAKTIQSASTGGIAGMEGFTLSSDVLDRLVRYARFYGSAECLVEQQAAGRISAESACELIRELAAELAADLKLNEKEPA
jgi:hypothetical protein